MKKSEEECGDLAAASAGLRRDDDAKRDADLVRMREALREIENLAPGLTWLASTDALHRAQEIARNARREENKSEKE